MTYLKTPALIFFDCAMEITMPITREIKLSNGIIIAIIMDKEHKVKTNTDTWYQG